MVSSIPREELRKDDAISAGLAEIPGPTLGSLEGCAVQFEIVRFGAISGRGLDFMDIRPVADLCQSVRPDQSSVLHLVNVFR